MLNNLVGFNKFSLMIIESFAFVLVARHRREIQQLIDSARDRTRIAHANISTSQYEPPPVTTPLRPNAIPSSRQRQPIKPGTEKLKQPSWFNRSGAAIKSFWKSNQDAIINTIKALVFGGLLGTGLIFLAMKGSDLIPHRKGKIH
jgi:hypothetical protein